MPWGNHLAIFSCPRSTAKPTPPVWTATGKPERNPIRGRRVEAIGQLTGGIAHDFSNILTGTRGYLAMARERADIYGDAKLAKYLDRAERSDAGWLAHFPEMDFPIRSFCDSCIAFVHQPFDCGDRSVLQGLGPRRLRQIPADQDADADPEES